MLFDLALPVLSKKTTGSTDKQGFKAAHNDFVLVLKNILRVQ